LLMTPNYPTRRSFANVVLPAYGRAFSNAGIEGSKQTVFDLKVIHKAAKAVRRPQAELAHPPYVTEPMRRAGAQASSYNLFCCSALQEATRPRRPPNRRQVLERVRASAAFPSRPTAQVSPMCPARKPDETIV
jgi:hypothetical protein